MPDMSDAEIAELVKGLRFMAQTWNDNRNLNKAADALEQQAREIAAFHTRQTHPRLKKESSMKLTANIVPYSSIVGGGLTLIDEKGRARFIVNFMGTTEGITKEETRALSDWFRGFILSHGGIDIPDRRDAASGK